MERAALLVKEDTILSCCLLLLSLPQYYCTCMLSVSDFFGLLICQARTPSVVALLLYILRRLQTHIVSLLIYVV